MLSREDMLLTIKYMNDYTEFCKQRVCGQGCPVYDKHEKDKSKSCFKHYCLMRESGELKK